MCVSTALIAQAFWGLSTKYRNNKQSISVIIICALIYTLFSSSTFKINVVPCMILLLVGSAIYSYYFK